MSAHMKHTCSGWRGSLGCAACNRAEPPVSPWRPIAREHVRAVRRGLVEVRIGRRRVRVVSDFRECCGVRGPLGFICTRPTGHRGGHAAIEWDSRNRRGGVLDVWEASDAA